MHITSIPFVQHTGIEKLTENTLALNNKTTLCNHMGTMHAGALYTLAESQSGLHLKTLYPELRDQVIPLLREGSMKYKKAVSEGVYALSDVSDEIKFQFEKQFSKKGRGSITVSVKLKDEAGDICAEGIFVWFIQSL